MPSLICRSLLPVPLASLFRLSTATSTLPVSWMLVWAWANAGSAAATASATSDFFIVNLLGFWTRTVRPLPGALPKSKLPGPFARREVESIVLKFPGGSKKAAPNDAKNTVIVALRHGRVARRQLERSGRRGLCGPLQGLFFKQFGRIDVQWPVMMGAVGGNRGCCFEVWGGLVGRGILSRRGLRRSPSSGRWWPFLPAWPWPSSTCHATA